MYGEMTGEGADHCPTCQRVITRDGTHIATGSKECQPTADEQRDAKISDIFARLNALIERAEEIEHTLAEMAEAHRDTDNRLSSLENKVDGAVSDIDTLESDLDEESRRINELEGK